MSARNRCIGPGGALPCTTACLTSSEVTSSTVPASLASPLKSSPSEALWRAKRGSRRRSRALTAFHMLPNQISPSAKMISLPLMRGDPSRRRVASVLCLLASNSRRARAASSGASASTWCQLGMRGRLGGVSQLPLVGANPLADRVVGDAVAAAGSAEPERADFSDQLGIRRSVNSAGGRPRDAGSGPARAALSRAVALRGALRAKRGTTAKAVLLGARNSAAAGAMRIERRGAVGTDDPEVLESVVVRDAVDVVEDHRHRRATPPLTLAAELTDPLLESGFVQSFLELTAIERRAVDQDLGQRPRPRARTGTRGVRDRSGRSRCSQSAAYFLRTWCAPAGVAHPHPPQCLRP